MVSFRPRLAVFETIFVIPLKQVWRLGCPGYFQGVFVGNSPSKSGTLAVFVLLFERIAWADARSHCRLPCSLRNWSQGSTLPRAAVACLGPFPGLQHSFARDRCGGDRAARPCRPQLHGSLCRLRNQPGLPQPLPPTGGRASLGPPSPG